MRTTKRIHTYTHLHKLVKVWQRRAGWGLRSLPINHPVTRSDESWESDGAGHYKRHFMMEEYL